jgi:hypothetical protein
MFGIIRSSNSLTISTAGCGEMIRRVFLWLYSRASERCNIKCSGWKALAFRVPGPSEDVKSAHVACCMYLNLHVLFLYFWRRAGENIMDDDDLPEWLFPYFGECYTGPWWSDCKFQSSTSRGKATPRSHLDKRSKIHDNSYALCIGYDCLDSADALYFESTRNMSAIPRFIGTMPYYGNWPVRRVQRALGNEYIGSEVGENMGNASFGMGKERHDKAQNYLRRQYAELQTQHPGVEEVAVSGPSFLPEEPFLPDIQQPREEQFCYTGQHEASNPAISYDADGSFAVTRNPRGTEQIFFYPDSRKWGRRSKRKRNKN